MKVTELFEGKEDDLFMAKMLKKRLDAMGFETRIHPGQEHMVEVTLKYPPKTVVWIYHQSELKRNKWKAMWFMLGSKSSSHSSYKNLDALLDILKISKEQEQRHEGN